MNSRNMAGLLSGLALASSAVGLLAEVKDNPYQAIVTRNAFALKPPLPPAETTKPEPPPSPVDVVLTGISTLGGTKKALLQITDKSPSKAGKTEYPPPLVEGDIQGRVEVVSIDAGENKVVIKIDGNEKTLGFQDKEAAKPAAAPPPGAQPGMPGMPGMPPRQPTMPGYPMTIPPQPGLPAPAVGATGIPAAAERYGVLVGGGGGTASPAPGMPSPVPAGPGNVTVGGASGVSSSPNMPITSMRGLRTVMDASGARVVVGGGGTPNPAAPGSVPALPVPPPVQR